MSLKILIALITKIVFLFYGDIAYSEVLASSAIGRLLSDGDSTKSKGSLIFPGDRLNPQGDKSLKIICFLNRKILHLPRGVVDDDPDKCTKVAIESANCTPQNPDNCSKTKKNANKNLPKIINPYGFIGINTRPSISWLPHPDPKINSYTIVVDGNTVKWTKKTTKTTISYPPEQPPMSYGSVYKLDIIANQDNYPISANSMIVIMLSKQETEKIKTTIKEVENLQLNPDEKAHDISLIYASKNLLNEAIHVLSQRILAGTQDPTIYRLLGDRYTEAGLIEKAKSSYKKANELNQKNNFNDLLR